MYPNIKNLFYRANNLLKYGEYIPTEYYVFDNKELAYISIPKVACTSIKIALMANELQDSSNPEEYMNVHSETVKHVCYSLTKQQQHYYKFAFVRNPFDRIVSCYKDKVKIAKQHNGRYHFDTKYNKILIKNLFKGEFKSDMTFEAFVELVGRIPDKFADGHFKSQYSMLYHKNKRIADYVGKFENLSEDWKPLAKKFGLTELPEKNKTQKDNWQSYYNNRETIERVANRFKNDLQAFDYNDSYMSLLNSTPK